MKYTVKLISLAVVASVLFGSCSKDKLEEINVNPNQATDAPLHTIVNAAMVGSILQIEGENARLAGIWTQQFTGQDRQYLAYQTYDVNAGNFEWTGYYFGMAQQSNLAIEKAIEDGQSFYLGISYAIKGLSFGTMTALWGNIPYSQANNLVDFPTPEFDPQISVYNGVQSLLDNAITAFNSGGGDGQGIDWIYGGSADNWIKATNTLRARYALHTGNYDEAISYATSGILSSTEDMLIPHTGGAYNQDMNVYYSFGKVDREGYMGANDAHLPGLLRPDEYIYEEGTDDEKVFNFGFGAKHNEKTDETARFNDLYVFSDTIFGQWDLNYSSNWSATSPFPIVSAIENYLILAECYSRNSDQSNALLHLNNARAELATKYPEGQYDAYVENDFSAGGIADNGQGSVASNLLYEILLEKYASLAGQIEVFNDLRRTDNLLGLSPASGGSFPERFLIPQTELDGNPTAPRQNASDLFVPTPVNQ